jgi:outer membrane protein OmpA-like peptidoglycan-associated protein
LHKDPMPGSDRIISKEPVINKKRPSIALLILLSAVFLAATALRSDNIKNLLRFNQLTDQFVFSHDAVKENEPPESLQVSENQDINDASLTGKDKSHVQHLSAVAEAGQRNDTVATVNTHDNDHNKNHSAKADMPPVNDLRATIMFGYNSDIIDPTFYPPIENITKALLANPKSNVTIKGHADNTGPEMYNLDLSMRRSLAVKKMLLRKGIDNERIKLAFLGESNPAASNRTATGRMRNRRVEMLVVSGLD